MSFSDWLHNSLMRHDRACMLCAPQHDAVMKLQPLVPTTVGTNYQQIMHYPVLNKAAQNMQLNTVQDPNFDTWGLFNKPVI